MTALYKSVSELVSGASSERKAPQAAAVVSPNVLTSCQLDEFERIPHTTPTSLLSNITSLSHFSPTKSGALSKYSVDSAKVHSLPSTELRRDSFPPYISSTAKRSTAVVAPSLARTQPAQPATSMAQSAASSSLRFPSLPLSNIQQHSAAANVMTDLRHRYATSSSPYRPASARSLLAPSSGSSTGISYSLARSSALPSSSRSSASQTNTSHHSAWQSLLTTQSQQMREGREAFLSVLCNANVGSRNALHDQFYNSQRPRLSAANVAVTTISRTMFPSSQPVTNTVNLSRYHHPYHGPNQTSRPATTHYSAGVFPSSSAPSLTSQHQHSSLGRFAVEIV